MYSTCASLTLEKRSIVIFQKIKTKKNLCKYRLNILAELLQFGDREFYKDWWNAKTVEEVKVLTPVNFFLNITILLLIVSD